MPTSEPTEMTDTLVGAFHALATSQPDSPAVIEKRYGRWVERTAGQVADQAAAFANGLAGLGIGTGDTVEQARRNAYDGVTKISIRGSQHRSDIGLKRKEQR